MLDIFKTFLMIVGIVFIFLFPIGCMYGEDGDVKMPHNMRDKPLYSMKEICEMNGVKYEDGDIKWNLISI